MGTQPSFSRRIAFGPFELDPSSGQLRKHGIRIRLGGQPLQLLSVLLEQPGEVISREELRQQLWRDSAFGDFEHGLNAAVNKLRQALGDSAEQPRYVETLPGRGYRFIGPIHRAATETVRQMSPLAAVHTQAPPLLSKKTRAWLPWLAVSLAAGLAGGYWFGIRGRKPELAQALRFTVSPPSGFVLESASSHQTFALSPDGRRLAFTAMNASGLFSAWVREQGAIEPKLIPDSAGAHIVFWAPDSRSLILTVRGCSPADCCSAAVSARP
jgi:DNA-binding winged helix-turn-helix (wHTH) protein